MELYYNNINLYSLLHLEALQHAVAIASPLIAFVAKLKPSCDCMLLLNCCVWCATVINAFFLYL